MQAQQIVVVFGRLLATCRCRQYCTHHRMGSAGIDLPNQAREGTRTSAPRASRTCSSRVHLSRPAASGASGRRSGCGPVALAQGTAGPKREPETSWCSRRGEGRGAPPDWYWHGSPGNRQPAYTPEGLGYRGPAPAGWFLVGPLT
jgi:hypothetical protein